MADSGLAEPPDHLEDFPEAGEVTVLHRLSEWPGVWWYASLDRQGRTDGGGQGGRFDLARPRGTCYLAEDRLEGALVEKLLRVPVKTVPAERLDELFHATVAVDRTPRTADLTAAAATGFGLNAEIHSTLDYQRSQRWAAALDHAGWHAVRHRLRGDITQTLAGRALFGRAGLHTRAPAGMRTSVQPLDTEAARALLAQRHVEVRPIPATVPIVPPRPS